MTKKNKQLMPMAEAPPASRVRIVRIEAGQKLESRLAGMGLIPGTEVDVLRNDFAGPVVLGVDHNRVVLGRGMLDRILVARITGGTRGNTECVGR